MGIFHTKNSFFNERTTLCLSQIAEQLLIMQSKIIRVTLFNKKAISKLIFELSVDEGLRLHFVSELTFDQLQKEEEKGANGEEEEENLASLLRVIQV